MSISVDELRRCLPPSKRIVVDLYEVQWRGSEDVIQKLLTEPERDAWQAVGQLQEFTFTDVLEGAQTKNFDEGD